MVTLAEAKEYLRIDDNSDDARVQDSLNKARSLCISVSRLDNTDFDALPDGAREAVLYTTAYLYTHREDADHHQLELDLRHMLADIRKVAF